MSPKKGFLLPLVLIAMAAVGVVAGVYFEKDQVPFVETAREPVPYAEPAVIEEQITTEPEEKDTEVAPKSVITSPAFRIYKNSAHGFSVRYPRRLRVEEGKIEPNTRFVVFRDPEFADAKVSVIYIYESSVPLSDTEKASGESVTLGKKEALKFSSGGKPFYWVSSADYSLAISLIPPAQAGPAYDTFIDLDSLTF